MRRPVLVLLAVAGIAAAFAGAAALLAPPSYGAAPDPGGEPRLARLDGHESGVYPYISKDQAFPGHSPINLLVRGDASEVQDALVDRQGTAWRPAGDEGSGDAHPEDVVARDGPAGEAIWGNASGSDRYAYVHDGETGRWVLPVSQVQDGTYFGSRLHVRIYASPHANESWTALQAHTEYLDWFTLRHEVDGVAEAQRRVEADFMAQPGVEDVHRRFLDNGGPYDHDGWASVVTFAALAPLVGALAAGGDRQGLRGRARSAVTAHLNPADRRRVRAFRDRLTRRHGLLALAVAAVPLAVRGAGILLEVAVPALHVYAVAALLYPVLAVGTPVAAYAAASGMTRRVDAGVTAAMALGVALLADFAIVGARTLPLDVVLHRAGLVTAVGLVAAGASRRAARERRANDLVIGGAMLWVAVLVAAMFG